MRRVFLFGPLAVIFAWSVTAGDAPPIDRYRCILDRSPFGWTPAASADSASMPPPPECQTLRLCTIYPGFGDEPPMAGVVDQESKKSVMLAVGQTEDGLTLDSIDAEREEAVFRRGDAVFTLKLGGAGPVATAPNATPPSVPNAAPPVLPNAGTALSASPEAAPLPSYAERRKIRQLLRPPPSTPASASGGESAGPVGAGAAVPGSSPLAPSDPEPGAEALPGEG
jgi:hypothetical protein